MTEDYQPTRKEVFGEMVNGVRSKIRENASKFVKSVKDVSKFVKSVKDVSKFVKSVKDFVGMYAEVTALMISMPYAIPTYARDFKEHKKSDYDLKINAKVVGGIGGIITGFAADIGQVVGYGYAVKEDHPEFLLIPVATNIASGIYEIGRKMYGNARQRVLERHKLEGLEATLETAKQVQE